MFGGYVPEVVEHLLSELVHLPAHSAQEAVRTVKIVDAVDDGDDIERFHVEVTGLPHGGILPEQVHVKLVREDEGTAAHRKIFLGKCHILIPQAFGKEDIVLLDDAAAEEFVAGVVSQQGNGTRGDGDAALDGSAVVALRCGDVFRVISHGLDAEADQIGVIIKVSQGCLVAIRCEVIIRIYRGDEISPGDPQPRIASGSLAGIGLMDHPDAGILQSVPIKDAGTLICTPVVYADDV